MWGVVEVTRPADIAWLYAEAFNARDLDAVRALFAEDADYVNPAGLVRRDRDSIVAAHERALATRYAGARAVVDEVLERPVGDHRVLVVRWRLVDGDDPAATDGHVVHTTVVLERVDTGWRIVTAHSTDPGGG